jgi:glycosyltransferase involved in cell wall biosynthesis
MMADRPRVLALLGTHSFPPFIDDLGERYRAGQGPRPWLLELPVDVTQLDQRFLSNPPRALLWLYRRLPIWLAQAIEAVRVCGRYDVVYAWGAERVALVFALLAGLTRRRARLVCQFTWISQPKKRLFIRLVRRHITVLLLTPPSQARYATETGLMPPGRVVNILEGADTEFWRAPMEVEQTIICSAGREMRDYGTLVKALDGTDIPCCIAARLVRGKEYDRWRRSLGDTGERVDLPPNVTFTAQLTPTDLRDLYARSRFVVIPLFRSDTDNGINVLLEAWSMGRAVICSDIEGLRGIAVDGFNVRTVPVGDVDALRAGITELWEHPERAAALGANGRKFVAEHRRLDQFVAGLGSLLQRVAADQTPAPRRPRLRRYDRRFENGRDRARG